MKNLVIFSKHFWPENFKINDFFTIIKAININLYFKTKLYGKNFKLKKQKNYFKKINYLSSFKKKK